MPKRKRRLTIKIGKHMFTEYSSHRTKPRAKRVAEIQRNKGWLARIRKTANGHTVYVGAFSQRRRFHRPLRRD